MIELNFRWTEGWTTTDLFDLPPLENLLFSPPYLPPFPLSLWSATWLPLSQKDHSVSRPSHWDVEGHAVSLVMPERSDFHFNVTLLISQRCNVQDTEALSGLHISLIACAFTQVIITIARHISISAARGAITDLLGHGLQLLRRLKFERHLSAPRTCITPHSGTGISDPHPFSCVSIFRSFGIPLMDLYPG